MDIHDLTDFFRLSAILNLQLTARGVGPSNILSIIVGARAVPDRDRDTLLRVVGYLHHAYGESRRRLGSLAVLHPLRATALLARTHQSIETLDLLTILLHDKLEDLTPESIGQRQWDESEREFAELLREIDPEDEWYLMERVHWLTNRPRQSYFQYVGRMLDRAAQAPSLVRVKLADRLDNTLDMRIDIEDPIHGVDFFATVFQVMFVNAYPGYRSAVPHPPSSPLNGAQRMYQLFKNAVLLSLIRQKCAPLRDTTAEAIFQALAVASMKEAERITLHIFAFHQTDVRVQRELLMDSMRYVQDRGIDRITLPSEARRLDGLFMAQFEDSPSEVRQQRLEKLYEDKSLMVQASMAFITIFLSFLCDPAYYIRGIGEQGISPAPSDF